MEKEIAFSRSGALWALGRFCLWPGVNPRGTEVQMLRGLGQPCAHVCWVCPAGHLLPAKGFGLPGPRAAGAPHPTAPQQCQGCQTHWGLIFDMAIREGNHADGVIWRRKKQPCLMESKSRQPLKTSERFWKPKCSKSVQTPGLSVSSSQQKVPSQKLLLFTGNSSIWKHFLFLSKLEFQRKTLEPLCCKMVLITGKNYSSAAKQT